MKSTRILLVEDNSTLQFVMRNLLQFLGCVCEIVGTGEEALERGLDDIDLIFLDIRLPGIQGDEAAVLIGRRELSERVPIIALTGHGSRDECLKAGMDDFMQKPASLESLRKMAGKWVPSPSLPHEALYHQPIAQK